VEDALADLEPFPEAAEPIPWCDAFRTLDNIFTVDPRYAARSVLDPKLGARPMTIEDHWRDIEATGLHEGVPRVIRVHLDTARNLLLYSWFDFRFHQVAEMRALGSVEYALRHRAGVPVGARSSLRQLLARAVEEGWIRDEGFRHYRKLVEQRADLTQEATVPEPGSPTDSTVQRYAVALRGTLPSFRNKLAHGSPMMSPSGKHTLALCCDLINQLFPQP
jgi:hypothetical protein